MDSRSVPAGSRRPSRRLTDLHDDNELDEPISEQAGSDWVNMGATRVVDTLGVDAALTPPPDEMGSDDTTETASATNRKEISILGDYRLLKKIGEGAMGAVYKARQMSFQRDVALKVLFPHIANQPKLVERLYREGMVMGQLEHPNIVQAFGIGEDQGFHFVAMEFVEGASLQKWLTRQGRFSVGDALHVTLAVASALDYAHGLGVVHRDIKPDNVLISRDGGIKLTDLGMVKCMDEDLSLTDTGHAVGTPWYMPMEQAKNAKDSDGRSDIYALGCMLYCLLVGHPPFSGRTLVEVIQAKQIGTFPPARRFNADVPERLDLLIAKMAAKLPQHRHQNAAEVINDLAALDLANDGLEFIHGVAAHPPRAETPEPSDDSANSESTAPPDQKLWYVRVKNADGEAELKVFTTSHIAALLQGGSLNPSAQASHSPNDGFRALAAYKEFEGIALGLASKRPGNRESMRYRKLIKKFEAHEVTKVEPIHSKPLATDLWWIVYWPWAALGAGILFLLLLVYWLATGLAGH